MKDNSYSKVCLIRTKEFAVEAEKDVSVTLEIETDYLADDKYCLALEVIQVSPQGHYISYDNPGEKIIIQLTDNYAHGMEWHKEYWGNVLLPDVNVYEN